MKEYKCINCGWEFTEEQIDYSMCKSGQCPHCYSVNWTDADIARVWDDS